MESRGSISKENKELIISTMFIIREECFCVFCAKWEEEGVGSGGKGCSSLTNP